MSDTRQSSCESSYHPGNPSCLCQACETHGQVVDRAVDIERPHDSVLFPAEARQPLRSTRNEIEANAIQA
jgi:hypothetical protein